MEYILTKLTSWHSCWKFCVGRVNYRQFAHDSRYIWLNSSIVDEHQLDHIFFCTFDTWQGLSQQLHVLTLCRFSVAVAWLVRRCVDKCSHIGVQIDPTWQGKTSQEHHVLTIRSGLGRRDEAHTRVVDFRLEKFRINRLNVDYRTFWLAICVKMVVWEFSFPSMC